MKLFTAGIVTETCTFSPVETCLDDFEPAQDGRLLGALVGDVMAAFAAEIVAAGCCVEQGLAVGAVPAGPTTREAYEVLRSRFLADARAAMPFEAALLFLHGAMVAEDEHDCEGDLLEQLRDIVGPGVVVGVLIDPHAHLTARMTANADLIVAFKEWPHIDILDRARELGRLVVAASRGEISPVTAVHDCRMIDFFHTLEEPMKTIVEGMRRTEASGEAISVSLIHGFPFGDTPETGTKTLVITDGDPQGAAELARALAQKVVDIRGLARPRHLGLEEGVARVLELNRGPVVVADVSDAPGGGAPGDETAILKALCKAGGRGISLAYLHDSAAVDLAFAAGEGAWLDFRLGAARGGDTLEVFAEVGGLFPDAVVVENGISINVGDVALIRSCDIDILLSRSRPVALSADHFRAFGIDPERRRILIVKSVNNFRAGFEAIATDFIYIAGPGVLDTSLRSLVYTKVRRPIWPLDNPN